MKGFISRTAAGACLTAGLVAACVGCCGYADVVDPCYPMRYEYAARKEVCEARYQQVHNGHVLDQTVWNWQFERDEKNYNLGTDKLNPAGMDHLLYLIRRRPCPDQCIYLATAQDIPVYDPEHPEKFSQDRRDLDAKRIAAIQKYISAQTEGRGLTFHVVTHDPAEPDLPASVMAQEIAIRNAAFIGTLPTSGGGGGGAPIGGGGGAPGR